MWSLRKAIAIWTVTCEDCMLASSRWLREYVSTEQAQERAASNLATLKGPHRYGSWTLHREHRERKSVWNAGTSRKTHNLNLSPSNRHNLNSLLKCQRYLSGLWYQICFIETFARIRVSDDEVLSYHGGLLHSHANTRSFHVSGHRSQSYCHIR